MTFDPHPSKIVRPDKAPPLLMTQQQKLEALARGGMHGVAIVRFTPELAQWDPETFVRSVLVEWLHVAEVWVGANFLFGHDRAGNFSLLRSLGARYGFRAEKIDPVRYKDFVVSSTRVRRLDCGRPGGRSGRAARSSLRAGRHVVQGQKRGRELGFPTANLCAENELVPPAGVYATTATIDGVAYPSITNIGTRPTFESGEENIIETHVLDFEKDLYGAKVRLGFVQRLRDEKKFDGIDALKAQIDADRDPRKGFVRSNGTWRGLG